jgi:3-hydroxybutyryl-CoA dehydratase
MTTDNHVQPRTTPADLAFDELTEGRKDEERYPITDQIHRAFLVVSGDVNPLHVDDEFARAAGFDAKVAHGALLNAFLSHFVGMVIPGRRSLLMTSDIRYLSASHVGDVIRVCGTVTQRVESQSIVVLSFELFNETRGRLAARARMQVKVSRG